MSIVDTAISLRYSKNVSIESDFSKWSVWRIFLTTQSRVIKALEKELLEAMDTPLTWYDVLIHLCEAHNGRLRMQALADSVILSRSGITRLVDRMEKAGLVHREPSKEDRRGYYAVITKEGREVFERMERVHLKDIQEHFTRHLSNGDVEALRTALIKVLRANTTVEDNSE